MNEHLNRRTFVAGCALAAGSTALLSKARASEDSGEKLRVLTYNIHHGEGMDRKFDYDRLAEIISALEPDIVALQEVDRKTGRSSGVDQAAHLGELTGMEHAYGRAMYYDGGEYGEAILSKHSFTDVKNYVLPFRYGLEPRVALAVQISPGNGLPELKFVGTHLCHQRNDARVEQAQRINEVLPAEGDLPIILTGDLNARPDSEPMAELLTHRWTDAIAPDSRIDYVLYRQDDPWQVAEVTIVDNTVASDHRPVLAVLEWHG